MEKEVLRFIHNVRSVLHYQQVSALAEFPNSKELSSFLEIPEKKNESVGQRVAPHQADAGSVVKPTGKPVRKAAGKAAGKAGPGVHQKTESDLEALKGIEEEVRQCKGCALAARRKCSVCGSGGSKSVRLMLIGHWLVEPDEGLSSDSRAVFGAQEDAMLSKMMTAIHLDPGEVLVTNVIKCSVGKKIQPQAAHMAACSSYLQRQIKAAAPEMICTMGMVATRTLLQRSQPLSRLRGRFYTYTSLDGKEIPLLPTFHPGYLLQNPEMKKATWSDLQALEKRIAG